MAEAAETEKWKCKSCTLLNDNLLTKCEVCGTGRTYPTNKRSWTCIHCTLVNQFPLRKCSACGNSIGDHTVKKEDTLSRTNDNTRITSIESESDRNQQRSDSSASNNGGHQTRHWNCKHCTSENAFPNMTCEVCQRRNIPMQRMLSVENESDKWHCKRCTYMNEQIVSECEMCKWKNDNVSNITGVENENRLEQKGEDIGSKEAEPRAASGFDGSKLKVKKHIELEEQKRSVFILERFLLNEEGNQRSRCIPEEGKICRETVHTVSIMQPKHYERKLKYPSKTGFVVKSPSHGDQRETWSCTICTFENKKCLDVCLMCQIGKAMSRERKKDNPSLFSRSRSTHVAELPLWDHHGQIWSNIIEFCFEVY